MKRNLSKEEWVRFAINRIVKKGFESLSIDSLCTELNVTKGSFYHHFKNRKDLELQVVQEWERKNTERIIDQVEESAGSGLKKLFLMTGSLDSGEEIAFRVWGESNPIVADSVRKIDCIRISFLQKFLCCHGKKTQEASKLSQKIYLIFLGSQLMKPKPRNRLLNEIYKEIWES